MSDADAEWWVNVGRQNAYWGVLTRDQFLGEDLAPDVKEQFFQLGRQDMNYAIQQIRAHVQPNFQPKRALDFGCGVGRLMLIMSELADFVHGVDVAPSMLELARRNLDERGVTNYSLSTEVPGGPFDWINSYIVFQHIKPALGIELLKTLLGALAPDGIVSLHFTIFRDHDAMLRGIQNATFARYDGTTLLSYERVVAADMQMYEYDLSEIMLHLAKRGIQSVFMRHINHGGSHSVWMFGQAEQ